MKPQPKIIPEGDWLQDLSDRTTQLAPESAMYFDGENQSMLQVRHLNVVLQDLTPSFLSDVDLLVRSLPGSIRINSPNFLPPRSKILVNILKIS